MGSERDEYAWRVLIVNKSSVELIFSSCLADNDDI